jgi:hypothetical protein
MTYAAKALVDSGVVSNGSNSTLGDFDMARVSALFNLIKGGLDERADPAVTPESVVTNRFIDPSIGLK